MAVTVSRVYNFELGFLQLPRRGSNYIRIAFVPWTFRLGYVPAWRSGLLRVLRIKWRLPLLCQKYTISSQACYRLHNDLSDK